MRADPVDPYYAAAENPARWIVRRYVDELVPYMSGDRSDDFEASTFEALSADALLQAEKIWSSWPDYVLEARRDLSRFQKHLRQVWGRPLDALQYFILQNIATANVVMPRHHQLDRSIDPLFIALRHLHARACRAAWEATDATKSCATDWKEMERWTKPSTPTALSRPT